MRLNENRNEEFVSGEILLDLYGSGIVCTPKVNEGLESVTSILTYKYFYLVFLNENSSNKISQISEVSSDTRRSLNPWSCHPSFYVDVDDVGRPEGGPDPGSDCHSAWSQNLPRLQLVETQLHDHVSTVPRGPLGRDSGTFLPRVEQVTLSESWFVTRTLCHPQIITNNLSECLYDFVIVN